MKRVAKLLLLLAVFGSLWMAVMSGLWRPQSFGTAEMEVMELVRVCVSVFFCLFSSFMSESQ